ncbi:MAG: EAL domain-containing protein [Gammaproteobacteria bacterium]|nr:EAL domain-containing protein [Gammaproteobacteria bacterium]
MYFILQNYEFYNYKQTLILQESENRFKTLFDEMPDPAWIIANNKFLEANYAAAKMLGYNNVDEIQYDHPSTLSPKYQPDGELSFDKAERYMAIAYEKGIYRFEWIHCHRDGSEFPVEVTLSAITLRNQPVLYCIWRDITERKQAESIMSKNIERNTILLKLTTETGMMNERELILFILGQAERLTGSPISFLHYYCADLGETIDVCSKNGMLLEINASPVQVDPELWMQSTKSGSAVIENQPQNQTLLSPQTSDIVLNNYIIVPFFNENESPIMLGLANKSAPYDLASINDLELLTHHLWLLIQQKRNTQELELNSRVFHSGNEGIMITDAHNKIVSVNNAFSIISGYSSDELIGQTPQILKSNRHDDTFFKKMWTSLHDIGLWHGEIWNKNKAGQIYPGWLSISVIRDKNNNIINYVAMHSDMSEYKAAEDKIKYLAHFDALTNLPNRTLLQDRANVALANAKRNKTSMALLFIDLDRFKNINDSLGHGIGDELLKLLAQRLLEELRDVDTVSRTGGDEFIAILPNTNSKGAVKVADKLLKSIAQVFEFGNHQLNVTLSIGIALYPDNGDNFDDLSRNADTALYRAKHNGRNRYQFFNDEMYLQAKKVQQVENGLRTAIEKDELVLYYQPQVDTMTGKIVGAETLIRWMHPNWGFVPPGDFIQIAEESGMIITIGDWVLRTAIKQLAMWKKAGLPLVSLSVNVSQPEFRQHHFADKVEALLTQFDINAEFLELEITESIAAVNITETIAILQDINARGIKLSIDDFGTGYSSLSYLKQFKVDKLKIDQSFIREIRSQHDDNPIVQSIIDLATNLGLKTIAEGVETEAQLSYLRDKQCDQIQGYLFSKPLAIAEFEKLLALDDRIIHLHELD